MRRPSASVRATPITGPPSTRATSAPTTTASGSSKRCPAEWDHVIHINLSGAFYLSRAVLQHMLDRGYGRIVNISSIIGSAGGFGQANYAAAKSGMFGLTM